MPREKSRYRDRDRRSSSYSSDSSYDRKKKKHKRRSRSRDRSESSHKRRRSVSVSRSKKRDTREKRRSYSRSDSRDRYEKSRRRSSSRSKSKRSSRRDSRDRSRSRSSSRSRKHSKKSKRPRRSPSSSSRSSFDIEKPNITEKPVNLDDTDLKIEKAIKAAEAAGLTMTKIPTYEYKEVEIKEDMPTIHDRNLLAELNSDSFVQKSFSSSKSKKHSNIVIDLDKQTVTVPEAEMRVSTDESIINFDAIPSEEELKEMWVKKLYKYRKKMLKGEL